MYLSTASTKREVSQAKATPSNAASTRGNLSDAAAQFGVHVRSANVQALSALTVSTALGQACTMTGTCRAHIQWSEWFTTT